MSKLQLTVQKTWKLLNHNCTRSSIDPNFARLRLRSIGKNVLFFNFNTDHTLIYNLFAVSACEANSDLESGEGNGDLRCQVAVLM